MELNKTEDNKCCFLHFGRGVQDPLSGDQGGSLDPWTPPGSAPEVEDLAWYFHMYGNINHLIVISSRMEISIRISTNYRPCLCSSFSNAKLFCIMNSYWPMFSEGSSTQFKIKVNLLWSASYYGICGSLKISTPCQQWSNVRYLEGLLSMCKKHCFGAKYCLVYRLI